MHDENPLPPAVNKWVRDALLFRVRKVHERWANRADLRLPPGERDSHGDLAVPDERLLAVRHAPPAPDVDEAEAKLRRIEEINTGLFREGSGWVAHRYANHAYKGTAIEEIGCRLLGYHYAHRATGDELWRSRAELCVELLKARMFGEGHLVLKGHMVIDTTYSLAAHGLFLWADATDDRALERKALELCAVLREFQIAGSTNHGVIPALVLSEAYRRTGDRTFLSAAVRRVDRTALRNQLAYGGWIGHESWIWYHSIITASVAKTYCALPFTLEHQKLKDAMARCLYRAVNRIICAQREDGSLRPGRGETRFEEVDEYGASPSRQVVRYDADERRIVSAGEVAVFPSCAWEMLCLQILLEDLDLYHLAPLIRGFVGCITRQDAYWRFEFQTMASGIGLYLLRTIEEHPYERGN
jgi:hypothetical protein